ncbi:F-box WD repeat-containing 2 [Brachionus plicatilis]|uniref:F-box WD repeat-containing 2 n=1 Tax=Brachionus plicatilis TaxID=10195 RepID=A0A3M7R0K5_BRAPC|nr:F-box WD repeat-containing 2 [Brachionus plicatilis]
MECEIDKAVLSQLKANPKRRQQFFMEYLKICEPSDLILVEQCLAEYKRDFFAILPSEIVEIIIGFLDWKSLFNCCLVSKTWNEKISFGFNTFWYQMCLRHLPINLIEQNDFNPDIAERNYKKIFVRIMKESSMLEHGAIFHSTSFGPVEIEAISTYKNVVATGEINPTTHVVKFWTMDTISSKWTYQKTMTLQSRAQKFSFNDKHLLASTYFMTLGLYSMESEQFLHEYIGHTCSVTGFTFDDELKLVVSGSADGTVKFWPMQPEERTQTIINKPIRTINNLAWIVSISVNHYANNDYLVIILGANSLCYVNLVEKIDDFQDPNDPNAQNTFRFRYNLKISDQYVKFIDMESIYETNSDSSALIILNIFLIADNNSNQNRKVFCQRYSIEKNVPDQCLEVECMDSPLDEKCLEFLNHRFLYNYGIGQFEIVSIGLNFCLLVDEEHSFYMANLKSKSINKIDVNLNLDRKQKFYRILLNSIQEQFILGDKNWLNGFSLDNENFSLKKNCFPLVFYSSRRNECFIK